MTIKLGTRLAELRKAHNYSQEDLAERLGVSRQAISKWECGEASPDTDNLIELAKLYNTSLDELLDIKTTTSEVKQEVVDKDDDDDEDDEDIDEDEDEDDIEEHKAHSRKGDIVEIVISSLLSVSVIITYIILGTLLNLWGEAWVLFLLIPVLPSLVDAIRYLDMNRFLYPVFIVMLYLTINLWIGLHLWHPLWVLFLTIPVYYIIGDMIKKIKKLKK